MKLYSENKSYKLYQGNMLDMLEVIEPNSIDSIICDPPYELNFMNKGWDNSGIAFQQETWQKCYEVLKSGGYLLAFGGSRTFHRIACAIEDAGFEIRDTIMWLYGSGFPKSMNIGKGLEAKERYGKAGTTYKRQVEQNCDGEEYTIKQTNNGAMGEIVETTRKEYIAGTDLAKQWQGWGTSLKPAYEPIIVARKPFKGSLVDNVIEYGIGGLNIDECRVGNEYIKGGTMPDLRDVGKKSKEAIGIDKLSFGQVENAERLEYEGHNGRFPANVIHDGSEEVIKDMPVTNEENASRYFYCAKASKRDRDEGLNGKWFDNIEIILYNNIGDEIWKDKITIKEENKAKHLEDMEVSLQKVIEEFGIEEKKDIGSNIILFGKTILEKYLTECKYITKTKINSTTIFQILNWLTHYTTKGHTQDVFLKMMDGINLVENVENSNILTITINEKMASVLGVKNVVSKMQLIINEKESRNEHCTVKPTELMQYLIRLVSPKGATILDPFNGSGSTGKAVMYENKDRNANYKYIGVELTEEYLPISKARIEYVCSLKEKEEREKPITIFDFLEEDDD